MAPPKHNDPQKNPQEIDDDWAEEEAVARWLERSFRSWGEPEPPAIVVERFPYRFMGQAMGGFTTRPLLEPSGPVTRRGRPPAHRDPTQDYERTRRAFEGRGLRLSDVLAADLLSVSVRTIEGWRHAGLIGGGRSRR